MLADVSHIARVHRVARKIKPLSEQIRELIDSSGETRYRIAKNTGIQQSGLCKFMTGKQGLSLEALDTLSVYLGWEIRPRIKDESNG